MYLATVKPARCDDLTTVSHRRSADAAGWRGAAIGLRGRCSAAAGTPCAAAPVRDRSGSRFSSPGSGYPDSGCGGEFIRTSTWSHDGNRNSRNVARTAPQNSRRDPNPARTC